MEFPKITKILLFIILAVAFFFRFWNTPDRYGFDYDPVRDALIIEQAAKSLTFPLIGAPSGLGFFNFGPWYYYQLILFKMLVPFSFSPWIYIGILSLFVVYIMYRVGIELEGKKFGLLLAAMVALSPAETGATQGLSNPNLIPIHASLMVLFFVKSIKKPLALWQWFLWGVVFGIGLNNHYQIVGLFILPIITLLYWKKKAIKGFLFVLFGTILSFIPLFVYELTNNFYSLKGLLLYATSARDYVPYRWIFYVRDFWPLFWSYVLGLPKNMGVILFVASIFYYIYLFLNKRIKKIYLFLALGFLFNFVFLRYFLSQKEYYYLLFIQPFVFIYIGLALFELLKRKYTSIVGIIIIITILLFMAKESELRLHDKQENLLFSKQASEIRGAFPDSKLLIYECKKDREKSRSLALEFFLVNLNATGKEGKKIYINAEQCPIPHSSFNTTISGNVTISDVTSNSDKKLEELGIFLVSPKTIYNRVFDR